MPIPLGILGSVPSALVDDLFAKFAEIERNFREGRWEPSELNGGKLCEIAYTIIKGHIDGVYPTKASKPPNMVDACRTLEKEHGSFPRSVRIQIPRMLIALYEIRNNRGVGHVGGDVNPNMMDAICVLQMSKWIVCELVRVFYGTSTEQAQEMVAALSEREISVVWDTGQIKRILDNKLSMKEKVLLLLYSEQGGILETKLVESVEHSNPSIFRRDVLKKAHKERLIEYSQDSKVAQISPLGVRKVEDEILPKVSV